MRLVVLVPTFRRPLLLSAALESLADQSDQCFEIVVSDNDPAGSGAELAEQWADSRGWSDRLSTTICQNRGLSENRNHGLHLAFECRKATAVSMLDDDSTATEDWIAKVKLALQSGADLIGGPTAYHIPPTAPDWMRTRDMFAVPYDRSGFVPRLRSANNCTISQTLYVKSGGALFNTAFGATGGEDTELFVREQVRGTKMWWQHDAVVSEDVPPERCTREWVIRRHKTSAINAARVDVHVNGPLAAWPRQTLTAGRELLTAIVHLLIGSDRWVVQERANGAIGRLEGLMGKKKFHDSGN